MLTCIIPVHNIPAPRAYILPLWRMQHFPPIDHFNLSLRFLEIVSALLENLQQKSLFMLSPPASLVYGYGTEKKFLVRVV